MQDVRDLRRCADHLAAADAALKSSSWQGSPAVRSLCKAVYEKVADLYNRAEPVFLELCGFVPEGMPQDDDPASSAPDNPQSDPGTPQGRPQGE